MNYAHEITEALRNKQDEKGFKLLYKYGFPVVKRMLKGKYGAETKDVEDVFQDTVIIIMREIECNRMDETKNFENYIITISKNLWLNKLQKENRNISIEDTNLENTMKAEVEYHMKIKDSEELIRHILKQLGETCETILKAIIFENKKQEDIAIEMGLSDRHVIKTYKNRCKSKLIDLLNSNQALKRALLQNEQRYGKYLSINI